MPKTVRTAAARPPFAWAPVLHFANARPTDQTWPSVLLKFQGIRPGPGEKVFGLTSLAEVEPILPGGSLTGKKSAKSSDE